MSQIDIVGGDMCRAAAGRWRRAAGGWQRRCFAHSLGQQRVYHQIGAGNREAEPPGLLFRKSPCQHLGRRQRQVHTAI